ncbi:hypothetical protein J45TS6_38740 [Paenibacillus sp. J45TS6]|nr:hypothetical protein J45TS6_38740 [Paenibacillus sp. J45TS6]
MLSLMTTYVCRAARGFFYESDFFTKKAKVTKHSFNEFVTKLSLVYALIMRE